MPNLFMLPKNLKISNISYLLHVSPPSPLAGSKQQQQAQQTKDKVPLPVGASVPPTGANGGRIPTEKGVFRLIFLN
jgi:hypothetical protein